MAASLRLYCTASFFTYQLPNMKICFCLFLGLCFACLASSGQSKKYTKVPAGFLMVLRQGDSIMPHLEALAINEDIPSANFTGMGFVNIRFGFFNASTKQYDPKDFSNVELASMSGSIAWKDGKPSIHAHGVVAGNDFNCYGGHILSGTVGTGSLEILVTVHRKKMERKKDESIGAEVLEVP
jgi:predicted DNA-binding protein with PD1-like motif